MDRTKSRVYVMADSLGRITRCEGGYTTPGDLTGWTQIDEGVGDRYNLCQSHYFDGGLYTEDGIPQYRLDGTTPVKRTEEEIAADRAALPKPKKALTAQVEAAAMAFAVSSTSIDDGLAVQMPDLFPTWEEYLDAGVEILSGKILRDGVQLYRVLKTVTPQEHQPPHAQGMLSVYRPIDMVHAGTLEDPIPWVSGIDCRAGQYFIYNEKVYRVAQGGDMIPCTWPPDENLWQWELIK